MWPANALTRNARLVHVHGEISATHLLWLTNASVRALGAVVQFRRSRWFSITAETFAAILNARIQKTRLQAQLNAFTWSVQLFEVRIVSVQQAGTFYVAEATERPVRNKTAIWTAVGQCSRIEFTRLNGARNIGDELFADVCACSLYGGNGLLRGNRTIWRGDNRFAVCGCRRGPWSSRRVIADALTGIRQQKGVAVAGNVNQFGQQISEKELGEKCSGDQEEYPSIAMWPFNSNC